MSPVADPLAALRVALLADPTLALVVGERVHVEVLPGAEAEAMPRAGVLLRHAGGPGAPRHADLLQLRVDTHSYGPTPYTAQEVHWLVHQALRGIERRHVGGTLLHSVLAEAGPRSQRDPATEWPEVVGTWALLAAQEVPVA